MVSENRLVGFGVAQTGKAGGVGSFKAVIRVSLAAGRSGPGSRSPDEAQCRDREAYASEYDPDQPLHEPELQRGQIGFRCQRLHVNAGGIVLGRTAFVMAPAL